MFRHLYFVPVAAILLSLAVSAHAQTFNSVVVFGDSLTDSGNIAQISGLPAGTSFTTNPDPVWAEIVASTFGAPGSNSLSGGMNYAWGGACVNPDGPCETPTPTTAQQINQHLSGTVVDPDTLYMIFGGANDISAVVASAQSQADILNGTLGAAEAYLNQIQSLQDAGARHIVVFNLPDIGKTPNARLAGAQAPLSALSAAYNETLSAGLSSKEHGIIPVNIFALMNEIIEDPQNYGFTNVDETACPAGSNPQRPNGGLESLVCGPTDSGYLAAPKTDENYFFADGSHPSGATHELTANVVISSITAPVQISIAGEAGIEVARAHREAVSAEQIMALGSDYSVGKFSSYLRGQIGKHNLNTLSHLDKTQAEMQMLTLGTNYHAWDKFYLGAAFSWGNHDNDVSGASINSSVLTGSLQATWIFDVFYLSSAFNLGTTSIDINRSVQIGSALRTEYGSTNSSQFGTDVELGWALSTSEKNIHNLFLGLAWINQKIDGYSENGTTSTSMNFSDFERDSLVARTGYQFKRSLGFSEKVLPYIRIAYERELKDDPVSVTAGSNTMSGRFTLSGFEPSRQWVNTAAGLTINIGSRTKTFAGYSGRFGDKSRRDHDFSLGVSVMF